MNKRGLIVRASLPFVLLTGNAHGQRPAQMSRVAVQALDSDPCFSTRQFLEQVNSRLENVHLVEDDKTATVDVQVLKEEGGFSAHLRLQLEDGSQLMRSISAPTCDEASEAIAFVTSVALDETGEQSVRRLEEPSALEPPPDDGYIGVLALGAQLTLNTLPRPAVGPQGAFLFGQHAPGWWSPSFAFSGQWQRVTESYPIGTARFELLSMSLDLCPSQANWGPVSVRPCVLSSLGRLYAAGREVDEPGSKARPFVSAGAELLVNVELLWRLQLLVRGFGALPVIRDEFQFDDTVFHQAGVVTYGIGASVGMQLF